jgi:hypothetical protein
MIQRLGQPWAAVPNYCDFAAIHWKCSYLEVISVFLSKRSIDSISRDTETPCSFADVSSGFGIDHKDSSPVCTENLSSGVVVVKSAKDGV